MRAVVVGTSGAGKSTFAAALALTRGIPYIELDALHWLPEWQSRPLPELRELVSAATAGDTWVADGNYSNVSDLLWFRATHVVWLNYSRRVVHSRVVWRTLRRTLTRQELWSGNRERVRTSFLSTDSVILWSLKTFAKNRTKYQTLRESGKYPNLNWIEFQHPTQAKTFLQELDHSLSSSK